MYFYAWKKGLKTTYYLRSRPATRIAKATVETPSAPHAPNEGDPRAAPGWTPPPSAATDAAAVACSLENPESCEACQ
jgi:ribonucleoside-diphosphate reductase alpha chain